MTTRLFHISDVHFGVEDRAALAETEAAAAAPYGDDHATTTEGH
jgi:hypothetical protein